MSDGIYSALSGAVAQERALDVVANNVANSGTTGFRADRVAFEEQLSAARGEGPETLRYVAVADVRMDDSAGALESTGNPLDVALEGDGWFSVEAPQGERLTRAGSFVTDADGVLMTRDGFPVLGAGPERRIVIPAGTQDLSIDRDGTIRADGNELGQLLIRRFDPTTLEKEGSTLVAFEGAGEPSTASVLQGHLEGSNLNAVAGLNEMIQTTRSFEAFQRVIQTYRSLDERAARELGRS